MKHSAGKHKTLKGGSDMCVCVCVCVCVCNTGSGPSEPGKSKSPEKAPLDYFLLFFMSNFQSCKQLRFRAANIASVQSSYAQPKCEI